MHSDLHSFSCQEVDHMVKYGLHPGTLKGELFSILFEQGNKGMKVTELAKSSQVSLNVLSYMILCV